MKPQFSAMRQVAKYVACLAVFVFSYVQELLAFQIKPFFLPNVRHEAPKMQPQRNGPSLDP
jgi:hypothetical protein